MQMTEALQLLKRRSELESAMRQPGGIRITEERELQLVRRQLQELPLAMQSVIHALASRRPATHHDDGNDKDRPFSSPLAQMLRKPHQSAKRCPA